MKAFEGWTPKQDVREDRIAHWPAAALAATLGSEAPCVGDPLPPGWHWLYFLEAVAADRVGPDGHPLRGNFLPPVELPRRMYAGGNLRWFAPLRIGEAARRTSEIRNVEEKQGRTGPLMFVNVFHRIESEGKTCIEEEQNLVYRELRDIAATELEAAPDDPAWSRETHPDPVMLFRYSALTFNGHRIHYDAPYVREVEGYPDIVVHGPLMAVLLLELFRAENDGTFPSSFRFRSRRPVFANAPLRAEGRPRADGADLWIRDQDGYLAMRAEALP